MDSRGCTVIDASGSPILLANIRPVVRPLRDIIRPGPSCKSCIQTAAFDEIFINTYSEHSDLSLPPIRLPHIHATEISFWFYLIAFSGRYSADVSRQFQPPVVYPVRRLSMFFACRCRYRQIDDRSRRRNHRPRRWQGTDGVAFWCRSRPHRPAAGADRRRGSRLHRRGCPDTSASWSHQCARVRGPDVEFLSEPGQPRPSSDPHFLLSVLRFV